MRVESVEKCLLCSNGGVILYEALRDRLFSAPGEYNFYRCQACGFVWLNPRPVQEDIQECYRDYYTHQSSQSDRQAIFWPLCEEWDGKFPVWKLTPEPPVSSARRIKSMFSKGY